jgi:hypothetical protein
MAVTIQYGSPSIASWANDFYRSMSQFSFPMHWITENKSMKVELKSQQPVDLKDVQGPAFAVITVITKGSYSWQVGDLIFRPGFDKYAHNFRSGGYNHVADGFMVRVLNPGEQLTITI